MKIGLDSVYETFCVAWYTVVPFHFPLKWKNVHKSSLSVIFSSTSTWVNWGLRQTEVHIRIIRWDFTTCQTDSWLKYKFFSGINGVDQVHLFHRLISVFCFSLMVTRCASLEHRQLCSTVSPSSGEPDTHKLLTFQWIEKRDFLKEKKRPLVCRGSGYQHIHLSCMDWIVGINGSAN